MKLSDYAVEKARRLAACKTQAEANLLRDEIEADVQRSTLTPDQKRQLWSELYAEYRRAPKPLLEDTTSAQALNQLQAAVQQYLQSKK